MPNPTAKPRPIELCLERVQSSSAARYVRCTAQVGRALGLALAVDGRILWCEQNGVACEIWVSADQLLMEYCHAGTPPTTLYRAERALELPRDRPVVLRHRDELELAGTRFRVHVHGATDVVRAPTIVRTLVRAAATLALAASGAAACGDSTTAADASAGQPDAREVPTIQLLLDAGKADQSQSPVDGQALDAREASDAPIEVLENPPIVP